MMMMNGHPEDIDYDGVESWDEQIAEQEAWMAQQQQMDHRDPYHQEMAPPPYHQQHMDMEMGHNDPGWMAHEQPMRDHDGPGWMDQQHMGHPNGPEQLEIVIPEGCYGMEGCEIPVDFGGQRPFYVAVPDGLGPGMSFWTDMP